MTKYSKTNFVTTQICPYNLRFSNCTNIAIPTNIANPIHCNCPKRLYTCMSWRWSAKNWRLHHFLNFTIFWTSPPSFSCCCSPLSWMITIEAFFAIKRYVSGSLIKFHSLILLNWLTSNAFQKVKTWQHEVWFQHVFCPVSPQNPPADALSRRPTDEQAPNCAGTSPPGLKQPIVLSAGFWGGESGSSFLHRNDLRLEMVTQVCQCA